MGEGGGRRPGEGEAGWRQEASSLRHQKREGEKLDSQVAWREAREREHTTMNSSFSI